MELRVKVLVLTIISLSLWAVQPSVAKETHAHHAGHASHAADKGASVHHGTTARGTNSSEGSANDAKDIGVTVMSPPSAYAPDRRPQEKPSVKMIKPESPSAGLRKPAVTVGRNAIGQPITLPVNPSDHGGHLGAAANAADGRLGEARPTDAAGILHSPVLGGQNPRPLTSESLPSQGKIGGARLNLPTSALSGLGGPAKPTVGLDGTTLQHKR
jgi:hypothetical protein